MASEAVQIARENRKSQEKLARIAQERELARDVVNVLCDPLWSSVLGFIIVHEARQANLVGPVADDILYGGIIAINTARSGVAREAREGVTGILEQTVGSLGQAAGGLLKLLPMVAGGA